MRSEVNKCHFGIDVFNVSALRGTDVAFSEMFGFFPVHFLYITRSISVISTQD